MNLLTLDYFIKLFILTTILTNLFLLLANAYIFRQIFQMKVALSYTLNVIKKKNPEFGTDSEIEEIFTKNYNENEHDILRITGTTNESACRWQHFHAKIKVALAHPAASNGVCSRHRSKFR
jgi:hypothetical protein